MLQEEGELDHYRHFAPLAPVVTQHQDGGTVFVSQVIKLMNSLSKNIQLLFLLGVAIVKNSIFRKFNQAHLNSHITITHI